MSESIQGWILRKKGFVNYVNHNLARRKGVIGKVFTWLKVGNRRMGKHRIPAALKFLNHYLVSSFSGIATTRPIFSRLIGASTGPLNFSGLMLWMLMTGALVSRLRLSRGRDIFNFDYHDRPEFYYKTFGMLFPPNYLNNKMSAHYIEINHIYSTEMFKRYLIAKQDILDERDQCSEKEKKTRYITNPNYVYEPLGKDTNTVQNINNLLVQN